MEHFKTLGALHKAHGYPPPENTMISAVRCNGSCGSSSMAYTSDYYTIGFKKLKSGVMKYGKTKYDHENGSMSFVKPRQIVSARDMELEEDGFVIYFHEDYLNGHHLHHDIKKYGYFDYEVNEALHLSAREQQTIKELYQKIEAEYYTNQDEYSKDIILTHLDSILKYSQRFYKRQFIDRSLVCKTTISRFNDILSGYFESGLFKEKGLPTVSFLAAQLNISSKYLSDLLKQETGKTAIDHIRIFLISEAKNLLMANNQTISEIAYNLGFENPPYFSRLFRKETGLSPLQFKKLNFN